MSLKAVATMIYGLIILTGGVMGFVSARSVPSLISGGILGLAALIGGILISTGRQSGFALALAATILVGLFFAFQFVKGFSTGTFPTRAALILALSIVEILILLLSKSPLRKA